MNTERPGVPDAFAQLFERAEGWSLDWSSVAQSPLHDWIECNVAEATPNVTLFYQINVSDRDSLDPRRGLS